MFLNLAPQERRIRHFSPHQIPGAQVDQVEFLPELGTLGALTTARSPGHEDHEGRRGQIAFSLGLQLLEFAIADFHHGLGRLRGRSGFHHEGQAVLTRPWWGWASNFAIC